MRFVVVLVVMSIAVLEAGCVVHDRSGSPEPIWWPNFVVRESTLGPADGQLKVQTASPLLPPASADPPVGRIAVQRFVPRNAE
jgi:hypothetical protein